MSASDVQFYRNLGLLQPPRPAMRPSDGLIFEAEHLERLRFIKNAQACGFTHDDIATFVDPDAPITCAEVYAIANRRLDDMRLVGRAHSRAAICLAKISKDCPGAGPRADCTILEALAGST